MTTPAITRLRTDPASDCAHPVSNRVSYVTLFRPSRSLTDRYGRLRTLPPPPRHAGGVCTSLTLATLWMQEPTKRCEGAGLNAQGTGKVKNAYRRG